jgi:hypothetical protein
MEGYVDRRSGSQVGRKETDGIYIYHEQGRLQLQHEQGDRQSR